MNVIAIFYQLRRLPTIWRAKSGWLRIQSVNSVFALTLTIDIYPTVTANMGDDRHRPFAAGACSTSFATRMTVFLMRFSPAQ